MRTTVILLLSICFTGQILAQANFREGFIIKNNNDTVHGWIDFKLDEQNMRYVNFMSTNDSTVQLYLPGDIFGYRLINEGKFYISREIDISEGGRQLVFLEFLVQGLKNLYYFRGNLEYYFIENSDGRLVVMSKKPDLIENYRIKEDLKYRGILNYVFKDYESIRRKTEKADFTKRSMIELTKDYHDNVCEDGTACIIFENDFKKKFIEFVYSVYGGVQFHRMLMDFDLVNQEVSTNAYSIVPEIGGQITIFSPRFSTSLGLFGELSFSRQNGVKDFFIENTYSTTYVVYDYNVSRLTGVIGLKYLFQTAGKFRPVIEAGLCERGLISPKSELDAYVTYKSTGTTRHDAYPNYFMSGIFRDGFVAAVQLDYLLENKKYLFAKVGYSRTFTVPEFYNYVPGIEDAIQLKFGYIF